MNGILWLIYCIIAGMKLEKDNGFFDRFFRPFFFVVSNKDNVDLVMNGYLKEGIGPI